MLCVGSPDHWLLDELDLLDILARGLAIQRELAADDLDDLGVAALRARAPRAPSPRAGLDGIARLEALGGSEINKAKKVLATEATAIVHGREAADQAAESLLREFLRDCRAHGVGCVRIVHGKGRNSEERLPVQKNLVGRVLRHRADVLAFHSPPAAQGGTGAVLVLLEKR